MIKPIAAVDTDVLITLLDNTSDEDAQARRTYAELAIERLEKLSARFVVPAPVVAELCRSGPGSDALREIVASTLSKIRIEVLDEDAADIAGAICRVRLQSRRGRERGAVKFDALIAGVAHKIGAKWLLTANGDDMRQCFAAISSPVEVVVATAPPPTGQQVLIQLLRPAST